MPVAEGVSHWVPDPGEQPELRDMTIAQLLDEAVARWRDREAIVYSAYGDLGIDVRWTYAELRERARRVARALLASDLELGDRVGVWATNVPQWLELQFGAAYAGVHTTPGNAEGVPRVATRSIGRKHAGRSRPGAHTCSSICRRVPVTRP